MPWSTSDRKSQLPDGWDGMRAETLRQDGGRCVWPGRWSSRQCGAPATDVDHIRRGNDHSPRNRQSLCRHHHNVKTNQESAEVLAEQRAKLRHPDAYPKHPGLR